jgi:hypothetical protein
MFQEAVHRRRIYPVTADWVSIGNLKAVGDVVRIDLPATAVISDGSLGSPPLTQTVLAELDVNSDVSAESNNPLH